jgi:hypothetical protein
MQFEINLADSFTATSRGASVTVDVAKLAPHIVAALALHGLGQKVGDAAATAMADAGFGGRKFAELTEAEQAMVQDHARSAMETVVEGLMKGEWSARNAAEKVDELTLRIRKLFGEILRANAPDVWKAEFKSLDVSERGAKLDKLFAAQAEDFRADMTANANAELEMERANKAKLGKMKMNLAL